MDFHSVIARLRAVVQRNRSTLTVVAAIAVLGGIAFSAGALGLRWEQIELWPALFLFLVLGPLAILITSMSLQVTAYAIDRRITLRDALLATTAGHFADLLPIPGGMAARGAALLHVGAGARESAWILSLTAVLTIGMIAGLAGAAIGMNGFAVGRLLFVCGVVVAVAGFGLIAHRASIRVGALMLGIRIVAIALGIVRVIAAFAIISVAIEPGDAAIFVVCGMVGTMIAIVPQGLGVTEALAVAASTLVEISPAAAFLAVAVSRLVFLASAGALFLGLFWARTDPADGR